MTNKHESTRKSQEGRGGDASPALLRFVLGFVSQPMAAVLKMNLVLPVMPSAMPPKLR